MKCLYTESPVRHRRPQNINSNAHWLQILNRVISSLLRTAAPSQRISRGKSIKQQEEALLKILFSTGDEDIKKGKPCILGGNWEFVKMSWVRCPRVHTESPDPQLHGKPSCGTSCPLPSKSVVR